MYTVERKKILKDKRKMDAAAEVDIEFEVRTVFKGRM